MKKVTVNKDACIACGSCMSIAKNVFGSDNQGLSDVKKEFVTDNEEKEAVLAMESCPTNAILVEDAEEEHTCCGHCEEGDCRKDKE